MTEHNEEAKILIFEDDPDNLHLLEVFFESSGYTHVHGTSDGRNVKSLLEEVDPDVVLLDLHMPHVHGLDIMRTIHDAERDHPIPMIVTSGDISSESRRAGEEMGSIEFLVKPYEMSTLLQMVERALNPSGEEGKQPPPR